MSARRERRLTIGPRHAVRLRRISQTAHAAIALAVAAIVELIGILIVGALVASDGAVILFAVLWAFMVTSALYAYAEVVIRR